MRNPTRISAAAKTVISQRWPKPQEPEPTLPSASMAALAKALTGGPEATSESRQKSVKVEDSAMSRAGEDVAALDTAGSLPSPERQDDDAATHEGGEGEDEDAAEDDAGAALLCGTTPSQRRAALAKERLRKVVSGRLVAARETAGLSQTELAQALGYRNSTQLSLWEKGHRLPPHEWLVRIAETLGVSADYLLGLSDEPERDETAARRSAIVSQVRGAVIAMADELADRLLVVGCDVEFAVRRASLIRRAGDLSRAVQRLQAGNGAVFNELRGGAIAVRMASEVAEAAATVGQEMDRAAFLRERSAQSVAVIVREVGLPSDGKSGSLGSEKQPIAPPKSA